MYDPTIGQWLSEDPIGFDARDPNLRRYVSNSPLDSVDYDGLQERRTGPRRPPSPFDDYWNEELHEQSQRNMPTQDQLDELAVENDLYRYGYSQEMVRQHFELEQAAGDALERVRMLDALEHARTPAERERVAAEMRTRLNTYHAQALADYNRNNPGRPQIVDQRPGPNDGRFSTYVVTYADGTTATIYVTRGNIYDHQTITPPESRQAPGRDDDGNRIPGEARLPITPERLDDELERSRREQREAQEQMERHDAERAQQESWQRTFDEWRRHLTETPDDVDVGPVQPPR